MSVVEELRRNDPLTTSIRFDGFYENLSDSDVTEALEQNPHIVTIYFTVPNAPLTMPRLLHHLETRNNLHKVELDVFRRGPQVNTASVLQALQRNPNLRDFKFVSTDVPVRSLVPFLNSASQISHLSLRCHFEDNADNRDGPALLAASLQCITSLQSLNLGDFFRTPYSIAIFDTLRLNQSLQTLVVDLNTFSFAVWDSFKNLMRSTSTIRELVLLHPHRLGGIPGIIMEILKFNFSLYVVREQHLLGRGDSIFTAEERRLLAFYANRNQRMAQFIERPTSVPMNLRPEVLHVASQGNPSVLFRSLFAIRGELGTAKRTRKRKRPAYFEPS